ncbi:MAG: carboxymuconolactone decarboxylase family protein [Anaerolineales bacterium]|nr:carboxymuconolactone decarboxylase family protein [Anaerolineales bacterium]
MAFINTIPEEDASGDVRRMYEENRKPEGYIPNYVLAFSHRPEVMSAWGNLLGVIKSKMDTRRYELVTLATARALRHSYCMLAHGSVLCPQFYTPEQLARIATDYRAAGLDAADVTLMAFAEKIVRDATAVTQADIDELKQHGFSDAEIFDFTTAITVRCFFSKTLDALGVQPDEAYLELGAALYPVLAIGRPIAGQGS